MLFTSGCGPVENYTRVIRGRRGARKGPVPEEPGRGREDEWDQRQRVAMMRPMNARPPPMSRFHAPMSGIGNWLPDM